MKIKLLVLSVGLAALQCKAQISIDQSDFVLVGNKFVIASSDDSNLVPGGTGAQTWNFGSLQQVSENNYEVQNPQWTPYASNYSNANVALKNNNGYQFINTDNNSITAIGQVADGFNVKLNPTEKILSFPTTINTSFTNLSRFKIDIDTNISQAIGTIDSVRIVGKRQRTVTCDAYGNITTPLGTFPSLRVKENTIETDSIFAKVVVFGFGSWITLPASFGIPNPIIDTSVAYTWYAKNAGYKIFSFNYDALAELSSNVEWLKSNVTISGINELKNSNNTIYPNPANDYFSINNNSITKIEINSVDGKLIKSIQTTNSGNNINVEELNSGVYYVSLFSNNTVSREKLIIAK